MIALKNIDQIISGVRGSLKERNEVIKELYNNENFRSSVRKFILKKGGAESDVDDIFNYTIVQFIKTVTAKKDFKINSSLESYLFGIAKNLWFRKLKNRLKNKTEDIEIVKYSESVDSDPEEIYLRGEKKELILRVLENIGKNCKEVLLYWSMNYSMKEIAVKMNYKSDSMARKKKCVCLKELLAFLEENPEIAKELKK